ncbi:MAG: hypothetical protein IJ660_06285 [Alphaproteobacteria bacterium]|nr:hypothetical protein [Alphaproteobacteria bacterium]
MKKFIFDAIMASISVGGLSYDIFQMIEKLMELQYSTTVYFAVLAVFQSFFAGYFWGCADADLKKIFPNK